MYVAHVVINGDEKREQSVREHCETASEYSGEALRKVGLYYCGRFAGLIHDIGKLSHKFNDYIRRAADGETGEKGSVNHTFAAVIFILERYHTKESGKYERLTAEILAWAVASHHGLIDIVDTEQKSGFLHRLQKNRDEICYNEVMSALGTEFADVNELDELFEKSVAEIEPLLEKFIADCGALKFCKDKSMRRTVNSYFRGMTARLILSALIEGDRRDTAQFMNGNEFAFTSADKDVWEERLNYFEKRIAEFKDDSEINRARTYISDRAGIFAEKGCGIYRICVPTGAGKTLTTLRYALTHAKEHEKKRIIFVIPLLSVLEQNAAVIKDYIGDESIITEHHSNVVISKDDKDELDKYELLSQTWESPVLITTLVQLLNTLFSGKTTAVRRMSSLCNSVIVIDEVQSLPHKLLYMFNEAINFLSNYCKATIVMSSATQPCFEKMDYFLALQSDCDIVPYDAELFLAFKRTEITDKCTPYGMTLEELADFSAQVLESSKNLLIICNTRSAARDLYKYMTGRCHCRIYHLSNNMCTQHRLQTLKLINDSLSKNEKVVCVSTQLVECGVDFSFESCIRVKAGIDNIAQAAGRCNRSNDYGHICNVYVVSLKDEKLSHLEEIRKAQNCTSQVLYSFAADKSRFNDDILSAESINEYYRLLLCSFSGKDFFAYPVKKVGTLYDMLCCNEMYSERCEAKDRFILTQAFKTAGKLFEVFDDKSVDVIVPYNEEAEKIIAELCSEKAKFNLGYLKALVESAKPYMIHIFADNNKQGMLFQDEKGHFTALHKEFYNAQTGFDENNIF